jgi:hypothetical protein
MAIQLLCRGHVLLVMEHLRLQVRMCRWVLLLLLRARRGLGGDGGCCWQGRLGIRDQGSAIVADSMSNYSHLQQIGNWQQKLMVDASQLIQSACSWRPVIANMA